MLVMLEVATVVDRPAHTSSQWLLVGAVVDLPSGPVSNR